MPDTVGDPTAAEGYFSVADTDMPVEFERQAFDVFSASERRPLRLPTRRAHPLRSLLEGATRSLVRFSPGGLQPIS
jgi:hypothetical protein